MTEMERISRIRTAATWLRKTSKPFRDYPRRTQLDSRMQFEAEQLACGRFPWPSRWTVRLYHAAVDG